MAGNDHGRGWGWFDTPPRVIDSEARAAQVDEDLALAFARCFREREGQRVLAHLRNLTTERTLGPGATDSHLRHMEGQRQLVAYIHALVERGRRAPAAYAAVTGE